MQGYVISTTHSSEVEKIPQSCTRLKQYQHFLLCSPVYLILWLFIIPFLITVYWRSLLLHSGLQSDQAWLDQYGRSCCNGHHHFLPLFGSRGNSFNGHGRVHQPDDLFWYTAHAICIYFPGEMVCLSPIILQKCQKRLLRNESWLCNVERETLP